MPHQHSQLTTHPLFSAYFPDHADVSSSALSFVQGGRQWLRTSAEMAVCTLDCGELCALSVRHIVLRHALWLGSLPQRNRGGAWAEGRELEIVRHDKLVVWCVAPPESNALRALIILLHGLLRPRE